MRRVLLSIIACHALLIFAAAGVSAATITIDASTPLGEVNARIFGHNLDYKQDACSLWVPASQTLETTAGGVIAEAGMGDKATIRFPGGNNSKTYHWRRGVGPNPVWGLPITGNNRPLTAGPDFLTNNDMGTDEFMKLTRDNWSDQEVEVIIGVNWWFYGNPNNIPPGMTLTEHLAVGAQEAANWVEYCNGDVTESVTRECMACTGGPEHTKTVLEWAEHENWQRTRFVDPAYADDPNPPSSANSTKVDAVEWAGTWCEDEVTYRSWLSTSGDAPDGYFAWLRYKFLTEVHNLDAADERALQGYGIKYWEVGNEPVWAYQALGSGRPDATDMQNYSDAVIAYSEAMKGKDPTIKIGAGLDDSVRLAGGPPSLWDTTVLGNCKDDIDFAVTHLYASATDERYSLRFYGSHRQTDKSPNLRPIYLPAGIYLFRIRASGSQRDGGQGAMTDYPQLAAWLSPATQYGGIEVPKLADPCTQTWADLGQAPNVPIPLQARSSDLRHCVPASNLTGYYACYSASVPAAKYTTYQTDYLFDVTLTEEQAGYYIPWVTIPNNPNGGANSSCPDDGRHIAVQVVAYEKVEDPPTGEKVVEFRTVEDKARAFSAAVRKLSHRMDSLRGYIVETLQKPTLELGITEFGYSLATADYTHIRSLHSALTVTDLMMEMLKREYEDPSSGTKYPCVDFANFWCLNSGFFHVAQPAQLDWDVLNGYVDNGAQGFIGSPAAKAYHLFNQHFGSTMLDAAVGIDNASLDTFDSDAYDGITAEQGIPYLNAVASTSPSADGSYTEKIYVMVLNRGVPGNDGRIAPITINGVASEPVLVGRQVLECGSGTPQALDLDAQNTVQDSDLVNVVESTSVPSYNYDAANQVLHLYDTGESGVLFNAGTVSVLKITLSPPISSVFKKGTGQDVTVSSKVVTAVFPDRFYIEEPSRTAGIAVIQSSSGREPGESVTVSGTIANVDGERVIQSPTVSDLATPTELGPLGMRNEWLAGTPTGSNAPIPITGNGLYNVGLLVQALGKVTAVDSGGQWFYIDDGSRVNDLTGQAVGVRVLCPTGVVEGSYVRVTGIIGATQTANGAIPLLKPRNVETMTDWTNESVPLTPGCWNLLSLTGMPGLPGPEHVFVGNTAISLSGCLDRYDAPSQTWVTYQDCGGPVFGNCLVGEGYGLYIPYGGASSYNHPRLMVDVDQWISLPYGSDPPGDMSLIGNPFTSPVNWSACKVTDGVSLLSLPDAIAAGWIHVIGAWSGTSWQAVNDLDTGQMEASKAYEVYPARDNLALIIPDPN